MKATPVRLRNSKSKKESAVFSWELAKKVEERLRVSVNKLPVVMFAVDQHGVFMLSEGSGLKALGQKPGEVVGRSVYELFKDSSGILANIRRTLAGESFNTVVDLKGLSFQTQYTPIRGPDGKICGALGAALDITNQRRAEEEASLLQAITLAINAAPDLQSALSVVLRKVCEATGWVLGQVWVPSSDNAHLNCGPVWFGRGAKLERFRRASVGRQFEPGFGLPGGAWKAREPVWVRDVTRDRSFLRLTHARDSGLKSGLAIPILAEKEVLAVLEFFVSDLREEDERLVRLISAVAAQLGGAILRKRTEDELRRTSSELQAVFQALPDLYFLLKEDGTILEYRARHPENLYLPPEKFLSRRMGEILPPDVSLLFEKAMREVRKNRTVATIEYVLAIRERQEHFEARIAPTEDERMVVIVRNITLRKKAEQALRKQEAEQRIILDSVAAMIWYKDTNNRILRCNKLAAQTRGVTVEEMEGRLTEEFYPDEAAQYHADDMEVIATGKSKLGIVEVHQVASGEKIWVRTDKIPYRDQDGNIIGVIVFAVDITERMRGEEALRKSQDRFNLVARATSDVVWDWDLKSNRIWWNENLRMLFGYSENQMETGIGWWSERLHPDDRKRVADGLYVIINGMRHYWSDEYRFQRADGSYAHIFDRGYVMRDENGVPIRMIGAMQDITDRKTAEEQLKESEDRYRALFEHNPLMIFTVDSDGTVLSVNQDGAAQLGYRVDELVGRPVLDVFHEEDKPKVGKSLMDCLRSPDRVARWEFRKIHKSGRVIWVRETVRPVRRTDGSVMVLVVCEDVSEQKGAEEKIRESEDRYRQMFENNPQPMWVYDLETLFFLDVNEAAVLHYGYSREKFLSMTIKEIRPVEDVPEVMAVLSEKPLERRAAGPLRHLKKDGSVILVEVVSHAITFEGRKARVVMVNDITERRKAEQALLHSQKLESLGILAGGIAHDFNNLLMGILGNSDLALQKLPEESAIHVNLSQIKNASLKAADLCRQLLAYSGKGRFDVSYLNVNQLVEELISLLKLSIHKGITLSLRLEDKLPTVLADKVQIQQVIMNLVINSSEAIGQNAGAITITTRKVRPDPAFLAEAQLSPDNVQGDYILFEITDTGCGMDARTLEKIFDPFFTTKFTGRGLGLAAVLGIVRGHGGALRVRSQRGQGTTFSVLFPCNEAKVAAEAPKSESRGEGEEWRGSGTVLVVDDEEAVRAVSELIVPTLGFDVIVASDGFKACEVVREHASNIVAVLLDLTMPRMDGARTIHELRRIKPDLKVILMSGYDEEEAINRFTNEGFDCFLQKPFVRNQLRDKLRAILEPTPPI